jgi:uncharacterized LabA/DUF88 family protein
MKVAIFIDGKNFYKGWKQAAGDRKVDFQRMATWLLDRAQGTFLWGVYYYTGVETGTSAQSEEQESLRRFLDMIELLPGFFVYRFPRRWEVSRCRVCQAQHRYSREKEVDTSIVADMLRLAAVDAFDIAVLVSGDADHAPAVQGVRALGKQVYVATWGRWCLAHRMRQVAFDDINLSEGVTEFTSERAAPEETRSRGAHEGGGLLNQGRGSPEEGEESSDAAFLRELGIAEARLSEGYVGVNYFLTKWQAKGLTTSAEIKRRILDRLVAAGRVKLYTAEDGAQAIRRTGGEDD